MTNSERGEFTPTGGFPARPDPNPSSERDLRPPTETSRAPETRTPLTRAPLPGRVWGIVGLVLVIVPPAGLVVSGVGLALSLRHGRGNLPAVAGILISVALMLTAVTLVVTFATDGFAMFGEGVGTVVRVCDELGSGTHVVDGSRYTCP